MSCSKSLGGILEDKLNLFLSLQALLHTPHCEQFRHTPDILSSSSIWFSLCFRLVLVSSLSRLILFSSRIFQSSYLGVSLPFNVHFDARKQHEHVTTCSPNNSPQEKRECSNPLDPGVCCPCLLHPGSKRKPLLPAYKLKSRVVFNINRRSIK